MSIIKAFVTMFRVTYHYSMGLVGLVWYRVRYGAIIPTDVLQNPRGFAHRHVKAGCNICILELGGNPKYLQEEMDMFGIKY